MNYYKKVLHIPAVDNNDTILEPVERWKAHEEGILHRGYTVNIKYGDEIVLQHRKHPVFGGFFDLAFSSHQFMELDGTIQDINESITNALNREWKIEEGTKITEPKLIGKAQYKSFDGTYTEHELCHVYEMTIDQLPLPQVEFAYGFSVVPLNEIKNCNSIIHIALAPWVKAFFQQNVL